MTFFLNIHRIIIKINYIHFSFNNQREHLWNPKPVSKLSLFFFTLLLFFFPLDFSTTRRFPFDISAPPGSCDSRKIEDPADFGFANLDLRLYSVFTAFWSVKKGYFETKAEALSEKSVKSRIEANKTCLFRPGLQLFRFFIGNGRHEIYPKMGIILIFSKSWIFHKLKMFGSKLRALYFSLKQKWKEIPSQNLPDPRLVFPKHFRKCISF